MKAIAPPVIAAAALSLVLAGCVSSKAPPTPGPPIVPAALPAVPQPSAVAAAPKDSRDAPQTDGAWSWSLSGGQSTARFAAAGGAVLATLHCDKSGGRVLLSRAGTMSAATPMAVETTSVRRPLFGDPQAGWLTAAIPATDPLLDAIAFSRGRFALEAAGLATLYLPTWPELTRVVEDCR